MSDPVSTTEIEDVLTSIRRLVLENANAQPRPDVDLPAKLVLTPAFRVDEADQETTPQPDDNVVTLSPKMRSDDSAPLPDESEVAEQEAESAAPEVEAEAEDRADEGADDNADAEAAELTESDVTEPDHGQETDSLEYRIAELEAAVDECIVDFEPDGSETPDIPERMIMLPEGAVADEAEAEAQADQAQTEQADPQPVDEADTLMDAETPKDCAPETAREPLVLRVRASTDEADDAGEAAAEADAMPEIAWDEASDAGDDHGALLHALAKAREAVSAATQAHDLGKTEWVSASAEASQAPDSADAADDAAEVELAGGEGDDEFAGASDWEDVGPSVGGHLHFQSHAGADEDVLDEDTLREMVAQMLREELQGEIGERITHNVRRMVRREIARALSLQGVE